MQTPETLETQRIDEEKVRKEKCNEVSHFSGNTLEDAHPIRYPIILSPYPDMVNYVSFIRAHFGHRVYTHIAHNHTN